MELKDIQTKLNKLNKKTIIKLVITAVALLFLLSLCKTCGESDDKTSIKKLEKKGIVTEFPDDIKSDDLIGIVHFSGLLLSDAAEKDWFDLLFFPNSYSEILPVGEYDDLSEIIPKTLSMTFDALAIPEKTRLVIYEKENQKGAVILDETGPVIIQNKKWFDVFQANNLNELMDFFERDYNNPELQKVFPQSRRVYSDSNMNEWTIGSCVISIVK